MLRTLDKLSRVINVSACLVVDERGLLVSEYINSDIDKNGMAVMSSLLNGIINRFIGNLNLKKINFVFLNTPKGIFLIKEIPLSKWERKFTLSLFIENGLNKMEKKSKKDNKGFKNRFLRLFKGRNSNNTRNYNKSILKEVNKTIEKIQIIFNQ